MNTTLRNILILIGLALLVYLTWYFRSIIGYILVAGVISLIGRPVVDLLNGIRIGKFKFPSALSSILTLTLLFGLVVLFFVIFIPLINKQIDALSGFDASALVQGLRDQLDELDKVVRKIYKDMPAETTLYDTAVTTISNILNPASISNFAGNIVNVVSDLLVAIAAISFLAFFFLKDEGLFKETIMVMVPDQYEERVRNVLHSIKKLLIRYFIGIIIQSTIVLINITIGMSIIGFPFHQAVVMGLLVGTFNVIPYLGPWLGGALAILMGVATAVTTPGYPEIWLLIIYMVIVIAITQFIDNNLVQPLVYSRSVNAHPIEIFLVIMAVGSFAGIPGMIVAVPVYTAVRVFAREFFYNFGPVRKLTSGLGREDKETEDTKDTKKARGTRETGKTRETTKTGETSETGKTGETGKSGETGITAEADRLGEAGD